MIACWISYQVANKNSNYRLGDLFENFWNLTGTLKFAIVFYKVSPLIKCLLRSYTIQFAVPTTYLKYRYWGIYNFGSTSSSKFEVARPCARRVYDRVEPKLSRKQWITCCSWLFRKALTHPDDRCSHLDSRTAQFAIPGSNVILIPWLREVI